MQRFTRGDIVGSNNNPFNYWRIEGRVFTKTKHSRKECWCLELRCIDNRSTHYVRESDEDILYKLDKKMFDQLKSEGTLDNLPDLEDCVNDDITTPSAGTDSLALDIMDLL